MNSLDKGFRPKLDNYLGTRSKRILEAWGVELSGTPIPGHSDYRTALWYGNYYNQKDETVSLVIATPRLHQLPEGFRHSGFYFGAVTRKAVELTEVPLDVFAEAAEYSWRPDPQTSESLDGFIAAINRAIALPVSGDVTMIHQP